MIPESVVAAELAHDCDVRVADCDALIEEYHYHFARVLGRRRRYRTAVDRGLQMRVHVAVAQVPGDPGDERSPGDRGALLACAGAILAEDVHPGAGAKIAQELNQPLGLGLWRRLRPGRAPERDEDLRTRDCRSAVVAEIAECQPHSACLVPRGFRSDSTYSSHCVLQRVPETSRLFKLLSLLARPRRRLAHRVRAVHPLAKSRNCETENVGECRPTEPLLPVCSDGFRQTLCHLFNKTICQLFNEVYTTCPREECDMAHTSLQFFR